jgi:hypothetical protein
MANRWIQGRLDGPYSRAMVLRRSWPWLLAALAVPTAARAQEFRPIRDRDYAIDLHQGAALGDGRTVGMGGTGVATAAGSTGSLFNPAAAAVRPETSRGNWDWDWHFDYLSTAVGTDFDNNGQPQETSFGFFEGPLVTAGLVGQYRSWGLGVSFLFLQHPIEQSDTVTLEPSAVIGRITLARSFFDDELTLGFAFRTGAFQFSQVVLGDEGLETTTDLFSIGGTAIELGGLWRPPERDIRIGATVSLPTRGDEVPGALACDPLDCGGEAPGEGYILPERATLPWQASVGAAWRRGRTRWNRAIQSEWRDEKALLLAADLVVTGHVAGGYGVQAFAAHQLQPSGRNVGVSPRFGAEYEWVPGRFRIRGGTYWEPSRFRDPAGESIDGRLHVTLGLDVRVWSFRLWNESYRVRLTLTSDGARQYGNGGLSIGFWH